MQPLPASRVPHRSPLHGARYCGSRREGSPRLAGRLSILDTRSKIIPKEQAREQQRDKPACWVAGHFDPLLAEHVRRLGKHVAAGRLLIVEITNPAKPLLPQRARAELVAALTMVDYVVLGNGAGDSPGIDASVTERFVENVQWRHRGEHA